MVNCNTSVSETQTLHIDHSLLQKGTKNDKKRSFVETQEQGEINEESPALKKAKIAEEHDPEYEVLKAKTVSFVARLAIKLFQHQHINALVASGKINEGDSKHQKLQAIDSSQIKTYGDLEKVGIEVVSCLYDDDDDARKTKEIRRIKSLVIIYDTLGLAGVMKELAKKSEDIQ